MAHGMRLVDLLADDEDIMRRMAEVDRVIAEGLHVHRPGVSTLPPADAHTYCLDCGEVIA
jgi:hypothetical protein